MELIIPHLNADFDALASTLAATKLYPRARIFFPGAQEHNVRDFLQRHPEIIPAPLAARHLRREAIRRIILVDVSSPERLGEFEFVLRLPGVDVVRFDHHLQAGQHPAVRPAGANTTLMVQKLRRQRIPMTSLEATLYILGIYEETGQLTYTSTTADDLDAAAYLVRQGADLQAVPDFIKRALSAEQRELLQDLIKSRQTVRIRGVDVSFATAEREHFVEDLAVLATRLKDLEDLSILFVLCRMGKRIYVVARSTRSDMNVSEMIAPLGGGGHATAAAAVVKDMPMAQVRRRLLAEARSRIAPEISARAMMSSPVITVPLSASVAEARQIMIQFGHSSLPVMEGKSLLGMVTRDDLDKSMRHGLDTMAVNHVMSTSLATVAADEPMASIQRMMQERHLRTLPVVEQEQLLGMITRADVLRYALERRPPIRAPFRVEDVEDVLPTAGNLAAVMRERLPERILTVLHAAGEAADRMGMHAYVVGGFVRDILLKTENWDVDLVVEGDGIAFAQRLGHELAGRVKTHPRFRTARIELKNGLKLDIATARTEYYAQPAALPQVKAASIKYDLVRRDFTINAMAVKVNPADFGRLVDEFNGLQDLRDGLIRVLYAVSFVDDPTRIFRAVRFEQRYRFRIEPDTERYLRNALRLDLVRRLSWPRIYDELSLLLAEDQPQDGLRRLDEFSVLPWIHPGLGNIRDILARFENLWETFNFAVLFLDEPVDRRRVYWMALLDALTWTQVRTLAKRCQFPARNTEALILQKRCADPALGRLERMSVIRAARVVDSLRGLDTESVLYIMSKTKKTEVIKALRHYLTHWRNVQSLLGGRDLKKMGYAPGPQYERMLRALRHARLEGKVISRQDEVRFVMEKYPHA